MNIKSCLYPAVILLVLLTFAVYGGEKDRVIVLGFDGVDAGLVEEYMGQGEFPNLQKLRAQGTFAHLTPTNPPQTPVSWSCFATGRDPGETEIFDFLKRIPDTYYPTFAMMEEGEEVFLFGERNPELLGCMGSGGVFVVSLIFFVIVFSIFRMGFIKALLVSLIISLILGGAVFIPVKKLVEKNIPRKIPSVTNNRQGTTLWRQACTSFCGSSVFRVPNTFPPQELEGTEIVSGLGVPDIRGTVGTPAYFITDPDFVVDENRYSIDIIKMSEFDDVKETEITGPRNKLFPDNPDYPDKINIPLKIKRVGNHQVEVEVSGEKQLLDEGEWGDWLDLEFPFNFLVKVKGIARFHLIQSKPVLKLYLSPIHFHPADPPMPISNPAGLSKKLFDRYGHYKTMGWAIDTWSLDQEILGEEEFLQDTYFTVDMYEKMLEDFLKEDNRLLIHVFMFTDRVGHMFWRLLDVDHPAYDAELAAKYGTAVRDAYRRMDQIVGKAMEVMDENTTLIVLSDHGFATWRRSINYNTWLVRNGFMTVYGQESAKDLEDLFGKTGDFFQSVNWSKTKAYSMGLGNIYINVKDREPKGIVEPGDEYEKVRDEVIDALESYVDEETGLKPVYRVYKREEIYRNFDPGLVPDLRVNNRPPYRVSWQSALGGMPPSIIDINSGKWSGDHCSFDPEFVRGIFFTNRKINSETPHMIDLHPSILHLLGVEAESDLAGRNLFAKK